ncbi:hypothetical protein TanjilG_16633 [Lupinus angustifolius]|uniref:Alpha/beta hydrolase fold-3 domain-containing protein n=1 Tax=Lupinus angustifolius TaxID=3871 RepID=A0A4P1QZ96_LUPAN|nr:PREDICTED: probable carboxylesterase 18 [Lupinus angustifolius]OIV98306.1 hypothetical protein TanjilG_16633 [Lupinus angustifolius]
MSIPWKIKLILSLLSPIRNLCFRSNFTINRSLYNFLDRKTPPSPPSSHDVIIDPSRNLWFRLFNPSATANAASDNLPLPVIVYFHGGGFVTSSPDSAPFHSLAHRFSENLRAVVVSVNYRLAPEHRYPAQYDDGFDAVKFLDSSVDILPPTADLTRCFLAGDSAGGNLAHHVAVRASGFKFQRVKLRGVIALQPFFGGEERTESEIQIGNSAPGLTVESADWYWKAFLPNGSNRDHPAVNVFGPESIEISGLELSDSIVVFGGLDPVQDWQKRYCEGLRKAGKEVKLLEYPNAFHGFYIFPELPECSLMMNEIKDFMILQLKKIN